MSEQYVQGMREMRSHFGKAADKWIEVIHDIYPEFAKVNVAASTTEHATESLGNTTLAAGFFKTSI